MFVGSLDSTTLARAVTDLHRRLGDTGLDLSSLGVALGLADVRFEDLLKLVSAYELYAAVEFRLEDGKPFWVKTDRDESFGVGAGTGPADSDARIRALEAELASLRTSRPENALLPLSAPALASFRSSGTKPRWMISMCDVLDSYLSDVSEAAASQALEHIWRLITETDASYLSTYR